MSETISISTVIDVKQFLAEVDRLAIEKRMDYIDAVVYYCEHNDMEIETAAKLIKQNQKFKAKIRQDAEDLRYLPRTPKLPV